MLGCSHGVSETCLFMVAIFALGLAPIDWVRTLEYSFFISFAFSINRCISDMMEVSSGISAAWESSLARRSAFSISCESWCACLWRRSCLDRETDCSWFERFFSQNCSSFVSRTKRVLISSETNSSCLLILCRDSSRGFKDERRRFRTCTISTNSTCIIF